MGTNKQEPQHYQLKWNNHHANLSCVFEQLLQAEAFTDVTIACDGTSLKCHKMVLAACSSYFQKLFTDNPCQHPIVVLKDVRFSVFHSLLDFMYKGEVNVSEADLPSLMKLADSLKIKGLVEESSPHPPPPLSPIQSLTKVGDGTKNSSTWTSDDLLNNRASLVPSSNPASKSVPPIACLNSSSPPLGPKFNVITANGGDERSPSRESGSSSAGSVSDVRMAAKSGFLGALSIQHPILRNALGTGNGITGVSDSSSAYDSSDNVDRNSVLLERTERIAADVDICCALSGKFISGLC
ncbi:unnamed protein product [Notodromas monacha]|uniref:BTB domain-containing protein n=1 Tax=Notodromas monacha TaxID=399045 RepID=A0A7R9BM25_9CRUS|nr:unnamed protein product [Notodromas monacha]CAG0917998.1 unnamed protein product [Notodromas monacha]